MLVCVTGSVLQMFSPLSVLSLFTYSNGRLILQNIHIQCQLMYNGIETSTIVNLTLHIISVSLFNFKYIKKVVTKRIKNKTY